MVYLQFNNTNDEDVTLLRFASLKTALRWIEDFDVQEFVLTDIVDQTGIINGWQPEDFTLKHYLGFEM